MIIFREAGFDIKMVGRRVPVDTLYRWRKIYNLLGEDGLIRETRPASNSQ